MHAKLIRQIVLTLTRTELKSSNAVSLVMLPEANHHRQARSSCSAPPRLCVSRAGERADGVVRDNGLPDVAAPSAFQHAVEDLSPETLVFLLGSRYCETDRPSDVAWSLFQKSAPGWARVQSICNFVHSHITSGYEHARPTMTTWKVFNEGKSVCRDYAHLAITFCRCMNIPRGIAAAIFETLACRRRMAYGFRRLVRGLSGWAVHVRRAQQHAANRLRANRAKARCG